MKRRTALGLLLGTSAAAALPAQAQSASPLVVLFGATPGGFDGDALKPYTQNVVVQVNEPLVAYRHVKGPGGREILDYAQIEGALAQSWRVEDGGKRVVFTLRQGIKSPYGNELTAADVAWSWQKSLAQKRTGAFLANVANVTDVQEVTKYEAAFILSSPSSLLLPVLTLYAPGIYDSTEMKKHATASDPWALGWLDDHTANFGPYHLQSVKPYEQAVFVANPNFYKDKPYFSTVIVRAVPSAASRITLLKTGQAHYIERPTFQQVADLQNDKSVRIESTEGRLFAALWLNAKMPVFSDLRVRQALNYAVDKDSIRKSVFHGFADPGVSIVAPTVPGTLKAEEYKYDPDRAKALLKDAGHETGLEFDIVYSDIFAWQEQGAIQLSGQLAKIGIKATPKRITAADMRAAMAPNVRNMPAFVLEDGAIVPDAVYSVALVSTPTGVSNRNDYSNDEVTKLIAQARTELDDAKRLELVTQVQKLVVADAPYVVLGYPRIFEAMSPKIAGWVPRPDDHPRWADFRPAV